MADSDSSPLPARDETAPAIILMGVSGSGKTAVGERVAARLGVPFLEGDSFHPPANVEKMASGVPLTDDDRWPWLDAIARAVGEAEGGMVIACSALRKSYRTRLMREAGRPLLFVFLEGTPATLAARLASRKGHFMPPSLLESQIATLEPPGPDEPVITVSIEPPLEDVVDATIASITARDLATGAGQPTFR